MVGKYEAYPEYKEFESIFLNQIPSSWEVKPLYSVSDFKHGKAHEPFIDDEGQYKCVSARFVSTHGQKVKYCTRNLTPTIRNDILMVMSDLPNGRALAKAFYVSDPTGLAVNQRVCAITATKVFPKFLFYQLDRSPYFLMFDDGSNQTHLSNEAYRKYPVLLPTWAEQEIIANFLDHETAKIDTLIEEQQSLIRLLQEKRQAVISHAVTKGLNPQAPMKDSGVEWLGEVPEHWDVAPIKHICTLLKDGTHLPPPRVDSGVPLLSVRNIIKGKFVFRSDDSNISETDYEKLCKPFIPKKGDVLLAIVGATLGKVAIVGDMERFHIQRSLAIFRTKQRVITSYYLANIFSSSNFQNLLWENVGFSAQPGIYLGALENFRVPVAPAEEQDEINQHCKEKSDRYDVLISEAESAIQIMQERRTALISAAVTGKIDVRNWVAPTPEKQEQQPAIEAH